MDPDSYFSIPFLLLGSLIALLSATLSYLSSQKLKNELENDNKNALQLQILRNRYEENLNSLFIIEIISYCLFFTFKIHAHLELYGLLFSLISIIGLRIIFYFVGVRFADEFAFKLTPLIKFFCNAGYFFSSTVNQLNNLTGGKTTNEEVKEEINAVMETALEEGTIDHDEYRIFKGIMEFGKVFVEDVMTPRTVVFSAKAGLTVKEIIENPDLKNYSRIPIYEGDNIDQGLKGYVLSRDLYLAALEGKLDWEIRDFAKEIFIISEESPLDEALEKFLSRKQHLFAVIDEYGGFEGLITMEDVLETIIGAEIVDEADIEIDLRDMAKRKRDNRIQSKK